MADDSPPHPAPSSTVTIGRYILHRQIARGGMATIHIARLLGDEGFSRIVAAKRLLPELAEDTDFVAMFMDEARIASKVHHRNVVPVLDLVTTSDEVMLVQEYVHGVPLHVLLRIAKQSKSRIPPKIAVSIITQVAAGLHAAHETRDELGQQLEIVHRDVSPQNVMICTDGTARLLDFGIATATLAAHVTRDGTFKGKLAYSAPEQLKGQATRQSDVYALAVVLWELLVGDRMHGTGQGEGKLVNAVLTGALPTITEELRGERESGAIADEAWALLQQLEPIVFKGLAVDLETRYASAKLFDEALTAIGTAPLSEVAAWSKELGHDFLEGRDKLLAAEESSWRKTQPPRPAALPRRAEGRPTTSRADTNEITIVPAPSPNRLVIVLAALVILLAGGLVASLAHG